MAPELLNLAEGDMDPSEEEALLMQSAQADSCLRKARDGEGSLPGMLFLTSGFCFEFANSALGTSVYARY